MEKEQTLNMFHLTINKNQAKAISKICDLEYRGFIKPLNVKIVKFKFYKDNKRVRLTLTYISERDLNKFMYYVGAIESLILSYDK